MYYTHYNWYEIVGPAESWCAAPAVTVIGGSEGDAEDELLERLEAFSRSPVLIKACGSASGNAIGIESPMSLALENLGAAVAASACLLSP